MLNKLSLLPDTFNGIPTGNAYQMQEFNNQINSLGTVINLTHSQANIVEKNANRIQAVKNYFGYDNIQLSNINTISFGSPEYAGKDQGEGNTLDNASNAAGANLIYNFNNPNDKVSIIGLNPGVSALSEPENDSKELRKSYEDAKNAGHPVKDYSEWLKSEKVNNTINTLLNKDSNSYETK